MDFEVQQRIAQIDPISYAHYWANWAGLAIESPCSPIARCATMIFLEWEAHLAKSTVFEEALTVFGGNNNEQPVQSMGGSGTYLVGIVS
jgi:hypothetical protein